MGKWVLYTQPNYANPKPTHLTLLIMTYQFIVLFNHSHAHIEAFAKLSSSINVLCNKTKYLKRKILQGIDVPQISRREAYHWWRQKAQEQLC